MLRVSWGSFSRGPPNQSSITLAASSVMIPSKKQLAARHVGEVTSRGNLNNSFRVSATFPSLFSILAKPNRVRLQDERPPGSETKQAGHQENKKLFPGKGREKYVGCVVAQWETYTSDFLRGFQIFQERDSSPLGKFGAT